MAAAEARAVWQRAANRCLVQEDRKRAPKLACCPSSAEQQHSTTNGNCTNLEDHPISNFVPFKCNPKNSNLPPDIRWWLQLQPNFKVQKDLASEELYFLGRESGEIEVEDSAWKSKHEEPLTCEMVDTNPEKGEDAFEPPWMVSTAFMKHSSETGLEELKTSGGYSQVPLKCTGNATTSDCLYEDKKFLDFKSFDPSPLKNPQKSNFDMDAPWKEGEKAQPWWQISDENELASLGAERAMQYLENCDLPRPAQTVCVHRTESRNHENVMEYAGPSSPAERVSHSYPGQFEHIQCSYSTANTDEINLSTDGVWQPHERNTTYCGAQEFFRSSNTQPECKQTHQDPLERAYLLEALCHSQTRAREAEMAAKEAHNEKDDVIKLLLRQASHLFAYKQWLKISQLENICLQLKQKHKKHQIAAMIRELPWMTLEENPMSDLGGKDWTRRKGRRQQKGGGFCDAILFAIGLGLAGAGLLLGWTLGWLLPKL